MAVWASGDRIHKETSVLRNSRVVAFNESLDRLWFKKCKLILTVNHFQYFKKRVPGWGRRRLCQCQATQSCWLSAPACISLIWQPQTAGSSTGQITGPLGVLPRRGCSILISSCCRLMKCCRRYRAVQIIELKRCFCVSPRPGTAPRDGFRIDASVYCKKMCLVRNKMCFKYSSDGKEWNRKTICHCSIYVLSLTVFMKKPDAYKKKW